jgi:hypothetical protein
MYKITSTASLCVMANLVSLLANMTSEAATLQQGDYTLAVRLQFSSSDSSCAEYFHVSCDETRSFD